MPEQLHSSSEPLITPAVKLDKINKWFGDIHANKDISLYIPQGTIHGIIGENGAGKSTLMNILYGYFPHDTGDIWLHGELVHIHTPEDAIRFGIGMVFQHFMLVENFTVYENILLGREGGLTLKKGVKQAIETLEAIEKNYELNVDLYAKVETLPVGLQQRVEILKALYRGSNILILDEPTGVLTPQEADHLFNILQVLKREGKTIIFISHKLREILELTDQVSVMRRGEMVDHKTTKKTSKEELAALMVGRKVSLHQSYKPQKPGSTVLEARGLSVKDGQGITRVKNVNLALKEGEIVGIAGVAGNGQSELLLALAGMIPYEGEIYCKGQKLHHPTPKKMKDLELAHIPEDRLKMGLLKELSLYENNILGYQHENHYNKYGFLDRKTIINETAEWLKDFDVRPPNPYQLGKAFSGGNQQKAVLAREMEHNPDILLIGQPTRGVDIGAIEFIHKRILDMRKRGKAILLVSVELDEILSLSDRIIVMYDGMIMGNLTHDEADERTIGLMMAGMKQGAKNYGEG